MNSRSFGVLVLGASLVGAVPGCGGDGDDDDGASPAGKSGRGGSAGSSGRGSGGSGGASGSGAKAGSSSTGGTSGASNAVGGNSGRDGGAGSGNGAGRIGAAGRGGSSGGNSSGTGGNEAGNGGESGDTGGSTEVTPDPRCAAAEPDALLGSGTEADPYLVCTPEELTLIGTGSYTLGLTYALGDDLDLSSLALPFVPIGLDEEQVASPFTGAFEGRSHRVSGLPVQLFAELGIGGEVSDLALAGDGADEVHVSLLTRQNSGTVRAVSAEGPLTVADHSGLLVARNAGVIDHCWSSGTVTGDNHVGGLVGYNTGLIRRSFSSATVTGGYRVGGLVGTLDTDGVIEESFAVGVVTGEDTNGPVGGLVGSVFGGRISNSYARATVTGGNSGGLVGGVDTSNEVTIENAYAASVVTGLNADGLAGTLLGDLSTVHVSSSYFLDTLTSDFGEALSSSELSDQSNFAGWNFGAVWKMDPAISDYPSLAFETAP